MKQILTLLVLLTIQVAVTIGQSHPNIVLIIIDDMGWKDMGCAGSLYYETPHIDALADEGMRFVNAYSAAPVCGPSRGAIFTGKNPARTKFTTVFKGESASDDRLFEVSKKRDGGADNQYYEARHRHNIPKTETFFAEAMKAEGYATAYFGKWHCGIHKDYTPDQRGFDVAIGYRNQHVPTAVSGHWGKTFRPYGVGLQHLADDKYVAEALTDACVRFIKQNKDKPFVTVLSHYLVHNPIQAKPELVDHFKHKVTTDQDNPEYAAMLYAVDESVGRIVQTLEALNIEENTLVIFTSDNGGLNNSTSNYPLLGGKSYAFEAAMRVPFIAKWPRVIGTHQISKSRTIGMDLYPTFLEVANIKLRPNQHCDGQSILPIMKGETASVARQLMFHYPHYTGSTSPYSSIIDGAYKLIHFYNNEAGDYLLFNLSEDPNEQNDLSTSKPELTQQLSTKLKNELSQMQAELPLRNPNYNSQEKQLSNLQSTYDKAQRERQIQEQKLNNYKIKSNEN